MLLIALESSLCGEPNVMLVPHAVLHTVYRLAHLLWLKIISDVDVKELRNFVIVGIFYCHGSRVTSNVPPESGITLCEHRAQNKSPIAVDTFGMVH